VTEMVQVVHVFSEDDEYDQRCHMDDWFGSMPPSGLPRDAVCACGARMAQLSKDGRVVGVWHKEVWAPWKDLK
jgi:hypothetical protein